MDCVVGEAGPGGDAGAGAVGADEVTGVESLAIAVDESAFGRRSDALDGVFPMEADAEAKVKKVDFILYTDIATLKMNKLGGLLGGLSGGSAIPKTESKLEFKLFAVGETAPRLQSNTSAKEEGDENSVGTAVDAEARMVAAEVRKRGRG